MATVSDSARKFSVTSKGPVKFSAAPPGSQTKTPYEPTSILSSSSVEQIKLHFEIAYMAYQAYNRFDSAVDTFRKRIEQIKGLLDETKRSGTVFDLGLEGLKRSVSYVVGPIERHPFWKYHQQHFNALKNCIVAISAAERSEKAFREAVKIAKSVRSKSQEQLEPYDGGEYFRSLTDSFGPVYTGAYVLRMLVDYDIQQKKVRQTTIRDVMFMMKEVKKLHDVAALRFNELLSQWICLHQDRSAIIMLIAKSEREKRYAEKEGKAFGKIVSMDRDKKEQLDMLMEFNEGSADDLEYIVNSAITDVERVMNQWAKTMDKFQADLFKLDVFAAIRSGRN